MYSNPSHYPSTGYPNTYQQYPTGYDAAAYNYQAYTQYQNQPPQPVPPGDSSYGQTENNWNSSGYVSSQKDAVAQEMQQQKAQLVKQREDYVRKVIVLRRELDQLRMQKQDLLGDERGSKRDLANILKENDKLQDEIQGKMKAIQNVIEMLSSIIKDNQSIADLEAALTEKDYSRSSPVVSSVSHHEDHYGYNRESGDTKERYNYVHYDTGLHWCRMCDEFPETAKDFLLHLQEKGHRETAKENDVDNTPWHKLPAEQMLESYEDAPTKRVPIKGLQFFISAPSWYCKLCDVWIGDLHCASHHLKSKAHFQNYENFVSQNPHWEVDWLKDREKAMDRKGVQNSSDDSDNRRSRKRRKDKHSSDSKDKKKKKRSKRRRKKSSDSSSSSSSSDSSSDDEKADRSKSIRVTMRNVKSIMEEDLSGKWSVLEKLVEEHKKKQEEMEKVEREKHEKKKSKEATEDPLINQWMTVSQGEDKDKALFDSLKDRMKVKQEQEKAKQAELEKRRREKEQEELEEANRRQEEERKIAEDRERERKRREEEELNRIRDKERNQLKFKTNYRRRESRDDEDEREKYYRDERDREIKERYRRDSDKSYKSRNTHSRSPSFDKGDDNDKKKPPGPPSYKKLPFIGRMPLFKNKKSDEKEEKRKEIQKESYEIPRRTRFEPGNLPRAFMPKPDVVCFPKLSSIPPLTIPPPPTVMEEKPEAPEPPTISKPQPESKEEESEPLQPPPPPKIEPEQTQQLNLSDDEVLYGNSGDDIGQYYQEYSNAMYSQDMYYQNEVMPPPPPSLVPHSHTLPLEPPPLPPDDDLAMLGICADDMAAQSF